MKRWGPMFIGDLDRVEPRLVHHTKVVGELFARMEITRILILIEKM